MSIFDSTVRLMGVNAVTYTNAVIFKGLQDSEVNKEGTQSEPLNNSIERRLGTYHGSLENSSRMWRVNFIRKMDTLKKV